MDAAAYYDAIYDCKLYEYEARCVHNLAYQYSPDGRRLLDVACGTGRHIEYLKRDFDVEGLDICAEMIAQARRRNPEVPFHRLDMRRFSLGRRFDVMTCLFSSIGYARTIEGLACAIGCMAAHLEPRGILIVEPWYTPEAWKPGSVHSIFVDRPELKVARIVRCLREGRVSIVEAQYLAGTAEGVEHRSEREELGLFESGEIRSAMECAGLDTTFEPEGIGVGDKGVFVGRRPAAPA